jgi:hypothetical protein
MKRNFFLILSHLILIIIFIFFTIYRYSQIKNLYKRFGEELNLSGTIDLMMHEFIILIIGVLSLIGVIFLKNSKLFFFISTFYISTQCIVLFLAPSLSIIFFLKLIAVITFLWTLIYEDVYNVYLNKRGLKIISLSMGMLIYLFFLYTEKIVG